MSGGDPKTEIEGDVPDQLSSQLSRSQQFEALESTWINSQLTIDDAAKQQLARRLFDLAFPSPQLLPRSIELLDAVDLSTENRYALEVSRSFRDVDLRPQESLAEVDRLDNDGVDVELRHRRLFVRLICLANIGDWGAASTALDERKALREAANAEGFAIPNVLLVDLTVLARSNRWAELASAGEELADQIGGFASLQHAQLWAKGLERSGDLASAIDVLDSFAAATTSPNENAEARLDAAEVLLTVNRHSDALLHVREADLADAASEIGRKAWNIRYEGSSAIGDEAEMLRACRALAAHDPIARAYLPLALAQRESAIAGWPTLEQVAEPDEPTTPWDLLAAALARSTLDLPGGEELVAKALDLDPALASHPLVRQAEATLAADRGDENGVRQALAGTDQSFYVETLAVIAAGNQRAAATDESNKLVLDALDRLLRTPDDAGPHVVPIRRMSHVRRALILLADGRVGDAERDLADAESLPKSSGYLDSFSGCLLAMGQSLVQLKAHKFEAALKLLRPAAQGLASLPHPAARASMLSLLGSVENMAGQLEEAHVTLDQALEIQEDWGTLAVLGEVELKLHDWPAAINSLQAAARLGEPSADLLIHLAWAQRESGYFEDAAKTARQALRLDPGNARTWREIGQAAGSAGRVEASIDAFDRGLRVSEKVGTSDTLHLLKAAALVKLGRYADAVTEASSVGSANPPLRCKALHLSAAALDGLGDREGATAAVQLALSFPDADGALRRYSEGLARGYLAGTSWIGFWFAAPRSRRRKLAALSLMVVAAFGTMLPLIDSSKAPWAKSLPWVRWDSTSWTTLAPSVVAAVLFIAPVLSNLKVGSVELSIPLPSVAAAIPLDPPTADDIDGTVRRFALGLASLAQNGATSAGGKEANFTMPRITT